MTTRRKRKNLEAAGIEPSRQQLPNLVLVYDFGT